LDEISTAQTRQGMYLATERAMFPQPVPKSRTRRFSLGRGARASKAISTNWPVSSRGLKTAGETLKGTEKIDFSQDVFKRFLLHPAMDELFHSTDLGFFQKSVEMKVKLEGIHPQPESHQTEGAMPGLVDLVLL
jgi:hypothetical protein